MKERAPINYFGSIRKSDYTVIVIKVDDQQYAFRIIRTAAEQPEGITIQQLVIDQSETVYDDRDAAACAGLEYIESLFDPHKFDIVRPERKKVAMAQV